MHADTFSGRIFLALGALLLLFLGAAALVGELKLRSVVGSSARERRSTAVDLLEKPAADALAGRIDRAQFAQRLRDLGVAEKMRLTLIAVNGTVVADSEAEGTLANHADRPEVIDALRTGRGESQRKSATTGIESYYYARRVDDEGKALGVMRSATEAPELDGAIATLRASLLLFGVCALVVGLAAAMWLTRWLARPIEAIEKRAAALAAGDLGGRIHSEGPLEVRYLAETLNTMSRELRTRLESQRRARIEIETILASMAEGVVAVDKQERVLLMNHSAAELLGLDAPLEPGSALWERIRFPELEQALRGVLAGQAAWYRDAPAPRHDGRTLALSVAPVAAGSAQPIASHATVAHATSLLPSTTPASPAVGSTLRADSARSQPSESGTPAFFGAVALLSDVTAIRRLEQVRIDFVANVSHELRTPLAGVMGALETLADPEQDADTRLRFLDIANRSATRLQAIVSDLLDLSSIEAEGDKMPLEPLRVDAPLRTAAAALVGAAETKGVAIELPTPLPGPVLVNGNAQRLEQVFTNLLENAIKYTPRGGRVSVRLRAMAREVSVEVEDTGIGIPAASLPRVFERFYRVERSRSREMGGTGLGLAIVKHILRAHGGQVSVKSEEGGGSLFTVTLPRITEPART